MNTIVMACVSQKGGTGKSTLVRATAKAAANDDMKVKIGDLDVQQGTTSEWHRTRLEKKIPAVGSVELFGTAEDAINAIDDSIDLLLLDGPARASKQTLKIAEASHLVIQPAGPSLDDLKPAVLLFHELTKKHNIPKGRLVMVLTRVGTEAEFKDAFDYVSQAGYKVLDEFLFEKPAYRQAQNAGLTILETRYEHLNEAAKKVISALIDILLKKNG